MGAINITVDRRLGCEDSVEVGNILNIDALNKHIVQGRYALTTGLDTLGLNGGWIFFCRSFLKSMWFTKNGCFLISSAPFTPSRFEGSLLRRLVRMLRASVPMSGPKVSGSARIFWYILSVTSEVDDQWQRHEYSERTNHHRRVEDRRASRREVHQESTNQLTCLK